MIAVCLLIASLVADIDFSAAEPGCLHDRVHPESTPGFVRTENIYGRRLGDALALNPRLKYPEYALGRDGQLSAVRTGNALSSIPGSDPDPLCLPQSCTIPTDRPSTQLLWFRINNPDTLNASVRLAGCQFGYAVGFRLEWNRAHWCPDGFLNFVFGDGKSSKVIGAVKYAVPPDVWHQVAIVQDGKNFTLYVDGEPRGSVEGVYRFDAKRKTPPVELAQASNNVTFEIDTYRLYDEALTAAAIVDDWQQGQPKAVTAADEAAMRSALPTLKGAWQGFTVAGGTVRVCSGDKVLETVACPKAEIRELVVCGRHFPLCVLPQKSRRTTLGAVDLLNRQPELRAIGIRRTLVRVSWPAVEPQRNAYDWTALDRQDDACRKQQIEPVFVIEGEPIWYAKDRKGQCAQAEKFRRLVEARYETQLAKPAEIGYIDLNVGPGQVVRQLEAMKKSDQRHWFVKTRIPGWQHRYSSAYEGHPTAALLELATWLSSDCR